MLQPVGDRRGRLRVANTFEEDGELVAAEARERISGSQMLVNPLADGNEESVANLVAEAVVDQLEAVEVDEEHGKPVRGRAAGLDQRPVEQLGKERSVGESRQTVVKSGMRELVLDAAPVRDISLRSGHSNGAAGLIADGDTSAEHPAIRAVEVATCGTRARNVRSRRRDDAAARCGARSRRRYGPGGTIRPCARPRTRTASRSSTSNVQTHRMRRSSDPSPRAHRWTPRLRARSAVPSRERR